ASHHCRRRRRPDLWHSPESTNAAVDAHHLLNAATTTGRRTSACPRWDHLKLNSEQRGAWQSVSLRRCRDGGQRCVVVREWQIHKVPVLVSCEVIEADVLACGRVVGRTI